MRNCLFAFFIYPLRSLREIFVNEKMRLRGAVQNLSNPLPKAGFEPARAPIAHQNLNLARLPIPPLRRFLKWCGNFPLKTVFNPAITMPPATPVLSVILA